MDGSTQLVHTDQPCGPAGVGGWVCETAHGCVILDEELTFLPLSLIKHLDLNDPPHLPFSSLPHTHTHTPLFLSIPQNDIIPYLLISWFNQTPFNDPPFPPPLSLSPSPPPPPHTHTPTHPHTHTPMHTPLFLPIPQNDVIFHSSSWHGKKIWKAEVGPHWRTCRPAHVYMSSYIYLSVSLSVFLCLSVCLSVLQREMELSALQL